MSNNKGFTMIEVLIASSIFLSTILIFIPIFNQVQTEQKILSDRRWIANYLHEEMQKYIWEESLILPAETEITMNHRDLHLLFVKEEQFIKGCVQWKNAKEKNESFCLYGSPTE